MACTERVYTCFPANPRVCRLILISCSVVTMVLGLVCLALGVAANTLPQITKEQLHLDKIQYQSVTSAVSVVGACVLFQSMWGLFTAVLQRFSFLIIHLAMVSTGIVVDLTMLAVCIHLVQHCPAGSLSAKMLYAPMALFCLCAIAHSAADVAIFRLIFYHKISWSSQQQQPESAIGARLSRTELRRVCTPRNDLAIPAPSTSALDLEASRSQSLAGPAPSTSALEVSRAPSRSQSLAGRGLSSSMPIECYEHSPSTRHQLYYAMFNRRANNALAVNHTDVAMATTSVEHARAVSDDTLYGLCVTTASDTVLCSSSPPGLVINSTNRLLGSIHCASDSTNHNKDRHAEHCASDSTNHNNGERSTQFARRQNDHAYHESRDEDSAQFPQRDVRHEKDHAYHESRDEDSGQFVQRDVRHGKDHAMDHTYYPRGHAHFLLDPTVYTIDPVKHLMADYSLLSAHASSIASTPAGGRCVDMSSPPPPLPRLSCSRDGSYTKHRSGGRVDARLHVSCMDTSVASTIYSHRPKSMPSRLDYLDSSGAWTPGASLPAGFGEHRNADTSLSADISTRSDQQLSRPTTGGSHKKLMSKLRQILTPNRAKRTDETSGEMIESICTGAYWRENTPDAFDNDSGKTVSAPAEHSSCKDQQPKSVVATAVSFYGEQGSSGDDDDDDIATDHYSSYNDDDDDDVCEEQIEERELTAQSDGVDSPRCCSHQLTASGGVAHNNDSMDMAFDYDNVLKSCVQQMMLLSEQREDDATSFDERAVDCPRHWARTGSVTSQMTQSSIESAISRYDNNLTPSLNGSHFSAESMII